MIDKNVAESVSAIKQYISKSDQNADRHRANILIHVNKNDYGPGIRIVCTSVEGDFGKVIIEDLDTLCGGYPNTFTTKDCHFSFVAGTLCINAEAPLGGKISINIT